jgi:hypothetical protein
MVTSIEKAQTRADGEILHGTCCDNLTRPGERAHAGSDVHRDAPTSSPLSSISPVWIPARISMPSGRIDVTRARAQWTGDFSHMSHTHAPRRSPPCQRRTGRDQCCPQTDQNKSKRLRGHVRDATESLAIAAVTGSNPDIPPAATTSRF